MGLLRAAVGGAVAAMAMSGMRRVTTRAGLVRDVPPAVVLRERGPRALARLPEEPQQVAIELAHWAYGAFGGAAYELVPRSVRQRSWAGPLYGLALWVVFEVGIAPALGLRHARERRPVERLTLAVDHLLYGAILGHPRWTG